MNDPVANLLVTHSMGIILHRFDTNATSVAGLTNDVFTPTEHFVSVLLEFGALYLTDCVQYFENFPVGLVRKCRLAGEVVSFDSISCGDPVRVQQDTQVGGPWQLVHLLGFAFDDQRPQFVLANCTKKKIKQFLHFLQLLQFDIFTTVYSQSYNVTTIYLTKLSTLIKSFMFNFQ
jgi:hypothetical protein